MPPTLFPTLFSDLTIGPVTVKNRIFSTGHQTAMNENGLPTQQMITYQAAKAKGGAGLIITESSRPHETALQHGIYMDVTGDRCIEPLSRMADAVHQHGALIFGQLGHSGALATRRRDGIRLPVYSASVMHDNRFKNVARELSTEQITDIVEGYALAAGRYVKAGYDGIEIMASHGVLPAQFLNPHLNRRKDQYGGSFENRARFILEILQAVRAAIGPGLALGVRLSLDEKDEFSGLTHDDTMPLCQVLDAGSLADYFNITGGTMLTDKSSVNVVPPMGFDAGYLRRDSAALKAHVTAPVFYAGRINQPQIAEDLLRAGVVDLCGMTRAMIADPEMANKAHEGRVDDIIACIACNQACIGHLQTGLPISCIQSPSTGREGIVESNAKAGAQRRILIIGGGPAGMKAAVTAAERGHIVTLHEADRLLGGKARLAQMLPGREEFGGLITNLERQLHLAGVNVHLNSRITPDSTALNDFDVLILATGAMPHLPDPDLFEDAHVVHAEVVLTGDANIGASVLVYDWRGDWTALGVAVKLAQAGSAVTLVTEDNAIAQSIPDYVRSDWIGRCHRLGVGFEIHSRLYGAQDGTVFFTHSLSGEPVEIDGIDTLVLSTGCSPNSGLETAMIGCGKPVHIIGDGLSPRSAEEAIYEGWRLGLSL